MHENEHESVSLLVHSLNGYNIQGWSGLSQEPRMPSGFSMLLTLAMISAFLGELLGS